MLKDRINGGAKLVVRSALAKAGLELGSYTGSFRQHHVRLVRDLEIGTVWDVGAHIGEHAAFLRLHGYRGQIISIEPGSAAFAQLQSRAAQDRGWRVVHTAAGGAAGDSSLNISSNGQSSSVLPMLDRHKSAAPQSSYVSVEAVQIVTLDHLRAELAPPEPFAVKLDVQGSELDVLKGAGTVLATTELADVELSVIPLYEGGADWRDVTDYLGSVGLQLCDIERVFHDPVSGDLLQINGLFRRM